MSGSHMSGRHRTRNQGACERASRLDMRAIRRLGFLKAGAGVSGHIGWTLRGEPSGMVALTVALTSPTEGLATVRWVSGGQPDAKPQAIAIVGLPCRFGGYRYYFLSGGRRCEVLYSGGRGFASRQHHRLSYASQTMGFLDRLRTKRDDAKARAFGEGLHPRPRGANRERLVAVWRAADTAYVAAFAAEGMRRFGIEFD